MSAGIPLGMVPLDKYLAASRSVKEIYTATDWRTAYDRAKALRIEYLLVGPPERLAYPALDSMLSAQPAYFEPALRNGSVSIYHLAK